MMFNLPGAGTPDSPLMKRAREAVAKVMGLKSSPSTPAQSRS